MSADCERCKPEEAAAERLAGSARFSEMLHVGDGPAALAASLATPKSENENDGAL